MNHRVRVGLLACLGLAVILAAPARLRAQDFDLELVDAGKPVPNAEVLLLANAADIPLGTTDASGHLTVANRADIPRGTPVDVYEIECDGETVVVIVFPEDVALLEEECERRRRENPNCTCRRIGGFLWGDDVTIDVGTGTVSQTTAGTSSALSGLSLGATFDLRQMLNLEDVVGLVPGGSDESATSWAPGFGLNLEYKFGRMFSLGLEGGYSSMDTELRFPEGLQAGDLRYYELGGTVKVGLPDDGQRIWPYLTFGLYRTWNKADFTLGNQTEDVLHKTRRDGIGAGFDYRVHPNVDLRLEGLYSSTFEDDDADEHIRWKLGMNYRPFARINFR